MASESTGKLTAENETADGILAGGGTAGTAAVPAAAGGTASKAGNDAAPLTPHPLPGIDPAHCALFFDVDGTLIYSDYSKNTGHGDDDEPVAMPRPTPAVYDALNRLAAAGAKSFICTGRTLDLVYDDLLELPVTGIVSGAGACISMGGRVVTETVIDPELLEKTVNFMFENEIPVIFEGNGGSIATMPRGLTYTGLPGVLTAHSFDDFRKLVPSLRFEKFSYHDESVEKIERMGEPLLSHYVMSDLGIGTGEMSPIGVNKGVGVRHAVELLGEGPWTTFGFGDSENDLEMLRTVDVSVAMGNALPSVKAVARFVTDDVRDDGVVTALTRFGLI